MSHFQILAHGRELDVDAVLRATNFGFSQVWRRGDPKCAGAYRTSGVAYTLGDGYQLSMEQQNRIAIEFVREHRELMIVLAQFPGMSTFLLGLQCHVTLPPSASGFATNASRELMRELVDVGLGLTFYVTLDREGQ